MFNFIMGFCKLFATLRVSLLFVVLIGLSALFKALYGVKK